MGFCDYLNLNYRKEFPQEIWTPKLLNKGKRGGKGEGFDF